MESNKNIQNNKTISLSETEIEGAISKNLNLTQNLSSIKDPIKLELSLQLKSAKSNLLLNSMDDEKIISIIKDLALSFIGSYSELCNDGYDSSNINAEINSFLKQLFPYGNDPAITNSYIAVLKNYIENTQNTDYKNHVINLISNLVNNGSILLSKVNKTSEGNIEFQFNDLFNNQPNTNITIKKDEIEKITALNAISKIEDIAKQNKNHNIKELCNHFTTLQSYGIEAEITNQKIFLFFGSGKSKKYETIINKALFDEIKNFLEKENTTTNLIKEDSKITFYQDLLSNHIITKPSLPKEDFIPSNITNIANSKEIIEDEEATKKLNDYKQKIQLQQTPINQNNTNNAGQSNQKNKNTGIFAKFFTDHIPSEYSTEKKEESIASQIEGCKAKEYKKFPSNNEYNKDQSTNDTNGDCNKETKNYKKTENPNNNVQGAKAESLVAKICNFLRNPFGK